MADVLWGGDEAEFGHQGGDLAGGIFDLFLGVTPTKGKAEGGVGVLLAQAHCQEDVGGFEGGYGASRAGGDEDALEAEIEQEGHAVHVEEAEVDGSGEGMSGMAVEADGGQLIHQTQEDGPEFEEVLGIGGEPILSDFAGFGEADYAGDVLGAGSEVSLLAAAMLDLPQLGSFADIEGANSLRPIDLVGGHREESAVEASHVNGDLPYGLNSIYVEGNAGAVGNGADRVKGADGADLIVGEHQGDEAGIGADGAGDVFWGDHAGLLNGKIRGFDAEVGQMLTGSESGGVFDGGGDDMAGVAIGDCSLDGEVDALGAAAGEDHLLRGGIDEGGNLGATFSQDGLDSPAWGVKAGGIGVFFGEIGKHGVPDERVNRGGGIMVQVDSNGAGLGGGLLCSERFGESLGQVELLL